jgi:hypothetical protein
MRRMLLAAATVAVLLAPSPSFAVTAVQSGWWTSAPLAAAPDVPADGMLLQGGPALEQPAAYGAVTFMLDEDEQPGDLTLAVATGSATTPNASMTVCPLTSDLAPAQGGAAADGPTFDCASNAVAERSDDGSTFVVDVAAFAEDGVVAVALLPTTITDRIVLQAPAATSLATSRSSSASTSTGTAGSPIATGGASSGSGTPSATPSPVPRSPLPSPSPAAPAAPAAPRSPTPTTAAPGAVPRPIATAAPGDDGGSGPNRTLAFVALVALMGALWIVAGAPQPTAVEGASP